MQDDGATPVVASRPAWHHSIEISGGRALVDIALYLPDDSSRARFRWRTFSQRRPLRIASKPVGLHRNGDLHQPLNTSIWRCKSNPSVFPGVGGSWGQRMSSLVALWNRLICTGRACPVPIGWLLQEQSRRCSKWIELGLVLFGRRASFVPLCSMNRPLCPQR